MRLFLLGDFFSDNGPGNANKQIKESLEIKHQVECSCSGGRIIRIIEAFCKITTNDMLVICSKSKLNYFAIRIAKLFRKKIIYILHGLPTYELITNSVSVSEKQMKETKQYEMFIFANSDRVICVSKQAMEFVKDYYPNYALKMEYIYNVVDLEKIKEYGKAGEEKLKKGQVISVGGGRKQKNILMVAKAIEHLSKKSESIRLLVVGEESTEGEKIKEYQCVKWYDCMGHQDLCLLMQESQIYVQNSTFETFGLTIIEALYSGCDILMSENVGCKDLFSGLTEMDLIHDIMNQDEICEKILFLMEKGNNQRLKSGFCEKYVSREWQVEKLNRIIEEMC